MSSATVSSPVDSVLRPPPRPQFQPSPLARLALVLWVLVSVASCGRGMLGAFSERHAGIYPVYARAGQAWASGKTVYAQTDGFEVFRYSPLAATVLVPFALLPPVLGNPAWRMLNLGVFLLGLHLWVRHVLPFTRTWAQQHTFWILTALLAATGLIDIQVNSLVIGLLLLASADLARKRYTGAAVWTALACLLKVFPIAFGLLALVRSPRTFGLRWILALLVGLALPFLMQRPDYVAEQYASWLHLVAQDQGRQDWPLDVTYRDLRFLFRVYCTPLSPRAYLLLQLSVAGLMALLCWRGKPSPENQVSDPVEFRKQGLVLLLGLACCWMLVLGPATEGVTYILLAPSLAWATVEERESRGRVAHVMERIRRAVLVVAVGLLVAASLVVWFPGGKQFHLAGPQPLAGLLLLGCLLLDGIRLFLKKADKPALKADWANREAA